MYTQALVLEKARIIDPEILLTPPLIFTGGQKVRNLASFSTSLDFEWPTFENAARYLKSETNFKLGHDRSVSSASLVQFGPHTPEIYSAVWASVQNLTAQNVLNREQLCRGLFDFAQILHRVWTCEAGSTTKVQSQGVKGNV